MSSPLQSPSVTVIREVRPFGGPVTELVVVDGVLAERAPEGAAVAEVVEGEGRIALPTLVDAHIHPDKTAWGEPWYSRKPSAGLADYIAGDVDLYRQQRTPLGDRAHRLLAHAAAHGTRAVRAHVDVAPAYGLAAVEGLAEARRKLAGVLDVQIVAFPQHGVQRTSGVAELLAEAAGSGLVDAIGGLDPAGFDAEGGADAPGEGQLDLVFSLAQQHGLGVDIHLHDRGETGLAPLRSIAARARAAGLGGGRVTVSHVFCLPELTAPDLDAMADLLAEAEVGLTTVAPTGLRTLPFRQLTRRGVRVGLGSDGVRDSWSPFGNADMLHRTHLLAWTTGARTDEELADCFHLAASGSAELLGLPPADLTPGSPADLMLVDGECLPQIVVDVPPRAVVLRAGRVVARDGRLTAR